ncbi:GumC family protein [Pontivivens ytuae]|uniref:non-specific protein-tyrosine kinase n=1 Tax=Pontivivens ytuae TaxID=2789856 RepID=A0A7S9QEV3_9RHOB|nr:AAA family ATPase [Pontivivens ytuae]QPH55837.1 AAA family ATPase [Pontivivens ytuae]
MIGILRRQSRIVIYTTLLVLGLTALWLFSLTPRYTASSLLVIDPAGTNLLEPTEARTSPASDNARIASELEILRSNATALAVVEAADLIGSSDFGVRLSTWQRLEAFLGFAETSEPSGADVLNGVLNRFRNGLQVSRRGATYLLQVSYTSTDPVRAAELANLTVDTYIAGQVQAKVGTALAARDVIQARIAAADAELVEAELAFDAFIDTNFDRIAEETGRSDLADLRRQLEAVETESTRTRVLANEASRTRELGNWAALADRLQNETLVQLAAQRAELNEDLAEATTEQSVNLRAELEALENRLAREADTAIEDLRGELAQLETQAGAYQSELRQNVLTADLPPELLTQIFSIQQRGTLARTQYQTLLSRLRDFETQADLQVADARVVSPALPPSRPSYPNTQLALALALIGGLSVGVGLALLREFYIGGFVSDTQAEEGLGVPVPATIPRLAEDLNPADQIVSAPLSRYAEAFRRVRASIDQTLARQAADDLPVNAPIATPAKGPLTIMVASTLPAEGKTTTSLALARTYALSGKRTVLIDCDLRKPSVAERLQLEQQAGLLDFLTAKPGEVVDLEGIMGLDPRSDLEVIPSLGRSSRPTDQLLMSQRFTDLMEAVRSHYDVVVLDTPPMLPVVDGRYLAHRANAIVLVVKWAETRQQDVRQTLSMLDDVRNPLTPVFTVLNSIDDGKRPGAYKGYASAYYVE